MNLFLMMTALFLGCGAGDPADSDALDTDPQEEPDTETDTDEEPGPTTGPGVLGDETGLEAMCRRFFECGGGYYDDEQDCIDASYAYWGDCPDAKDALDALGACVAEVDCDEYNPDSYHPSSVGCGDEWEDLGESRC